MLVHQLPHGAELAGLAVDEGPRDVGVARHLDHLAMLLGELPPLLQIDQELPHRGLLMPAREVVVLGDTW